MPDQLEGCWYGFRHIPKGFRRISDIIMFVTLTPFHNDHLLQVFLDHGLLTPEELEEVLVSEFNPVRMGFRGISEITTTNVLNCGVSPERLLEIMRKRFLEAGGYKTLLCPAMT